ncbi:kinase-like domain-containing protein [Clohesyomyces aquaticus]|uniref:Kinase-like domain-containing protein n=1 Tax=Clohesyomyces aquaticus TaxID=1231657 RepID=A0A1Y1ZW70_9PLEO|nr:kinase-like domain-containing protein [Clohesyomyces aquaticus]
MPWYFFPSKGICPDIISSHISKEFGPGASVESSPGKNAKNGELGYWINLANRPSSRTIEGLGKDVIRWEKEEWTRKRRQIFLRTQEDVIDRSYDNLQKTTRFLRRPVDDIANRCQWQVNGERFCDAPVNTVVQSIRPLGKGAVGEVDEVRVADADDFVIVNVGDVDVVERFVRKTVAISRHKRIAERDLKAVANEIASLRKIDVHPHIVKIIGSYQKKTVHRVDFVFQLTYPVGDEDLGGFFERMKTIYKRIPQVESVQREIMADWALGKVPYRDANIMERLWEATDEDLVLVIQYRLWLEKWYHCLASALAFMHLNNVHHKDIKPKNVIRRGEHIYFTDFSSARNFEDGQTTTTESFAQATRLFAAPEACNDGEGHRHGSKADIFSLGLLFVEMMTVHNGQDVNDLQEYIDGYNGFSDTYSTRQYWRVTDRFEPWFESHESGIGGSRAVFETCVKPMLALDKDQRPTAQEAKNIILEYFQGWRVMACPCKDSVDD